MPTPVIMIHGAFCGGWSFANFVGHFSDRGWPCLALDLRHHDGGAADPRLGTTSLHDYTRDLVALISDLPSPPVLIGHSMGGLIAQKLAARGLAKACVLLAPAAPWGILPTTQEEIDAARGLMSLGMFWNMAVEPNFEIAVANSIDKLPPDQQVSVFDRFVPESGYALFELLFWMFDIGRGSAVDDTAVDCPVLVVSGSDDKVIAPTTARRIAELYGRRAELEILDGVGHWMLSEPKWAEAAELCETWISARVPVDED